MLLRCMYCRLLLCKWYEYSKNVTTTCLHLIDLTCNYGSIIIILTAFQFIPSSLHCFAFLAPVMRIHVFITNKYLNVYILTMTMITFHLLQCRGCLGIHELIQNEAWYPSKSRENLSTEWPACFQICRPCDLYMLSRYVDLVTTIYFPHVDIRPTVWTLCPGLVDLGFVDVGTVNVRPVDVASRNHIKIRINNILVTMTTFDFVITLLNGVNICLRNWYNILHEDNGH